jgi:hypothetical protein
VSVSAKLVIGLPSEMKTRQGSCLPCRATKNPLASLRCQPEGEARGFRFRFCEDSRLAPRVSLSGIMIAVCRIESSPVFRVFQFDEKSQLELRFCGKLRGNVCWGPGRRLVHRGDQEIRRADYCRLAQALISFQCGHTHSGSFSRFAHSAIHWHFEPGIPTHRMEPSTGSISLHSASRHRWRRSTPEGVRRERITASGSSGSDGLGIASL